MKKIEAQKPGLFVDFDYESLESGKGNNIGPLINMAILGFLGYWIYLSYSFYKR
jgi:ATP-dependent Zn protease